MPKKPLDKITWKKDDKYIKIDKCLNQRILINKETGKAEIAIEEVSKYHQ